LNVHGLHFIHPRSPITAKTVAAGEGWLHEPKLDGYRLQVVKEGRTVRLFSRRLLFILFACTQLSGNGMQEFHVSLG
jgi:hypothetical protein